jgi:hypothetical protein
MAAGVIDPVWIFLCTYPFPMMTKGKKDQVKELAV